MHAGKPGAAARCTDWVPAEAAFAGAPADAVKPEAFAGTGELEAAFAGAGAETGGAVGPMPPTCFAGPAFWFLLCAEGGGPAPSWHAKKTSCQAGSAIRWSMASASSARKADRDAAVRLHPPWCAIASMPQLPLASVALRIQPTRMAHLFADKGRRTGPAAFSPAEPEAAAPATVEAEPAAEPEAAFSQELEAALAEPCAATPMT